MPDLPPRHRPFGGVASHAREKKRLAERERAKDPLRKLYFSTPWRRASKLFLKEPGNDVCASCGAPSDMVHHKRPPRSGRTFDEQKRLFWDRSNWEPYCGSCNSRQAASAEGGFGNPLRQDRFGAPD